jgi:RNA polymerase primary sigma factor
MREANASSQSRDGLGEFLRRAARTKLLSAAEECALARRIERGDLRARERMIEANLLLVVSVAKRYRNPGIPLADLVQEGTIGLIRAVEKFDHRRGNRFSTYAVYWIRQHVARAAAEKSRLVRLPATANARLMRLQRLERDLRAQSGRAPTSAELAAALDLPTAEVEHLLRVAAPVASLDEPAGESGAPLGAALADGGAHDPLEALGIEAGFVAALLDVLSPRQREVIERRFGLAGHDVASPAEIARMLGVTRSRVHQLESEALHRMHRHLRPRDLPPGASPARRLQAMHEGRRGDARPATAA